MHIHQSVVDPHSGRNVFSDEDGNPTATLRHFIGGQQAGMADFTALFAPNVNAYQLLCHPYTSPNNACWSHDNRAAGLRIPASAPVARKVENRLPGADANPYLAIAASLAAGLYGIEHELGPTAPIQSEIHAPGELSLPCTLHAALERLKRSQLAKELFGKAFIEGYIASKSMEPTCFLMKLLPGNGACCWLLRLRNVGFGVTCLGSFILLLFFSYVESLERRCVKSGSPFERFILPR